MKNLITVLMSMLALTYFAVACGDDDDDGGNACEKLASLYDDALNEFCGDDANKDCAVCTEPAETPEASPDAGTTEPTCDENMEKTSQAAIDAWNDGGKDAYIQTLKLGCDAAAGLGNLGGTDTE